MGGRLRIDAEVKDAFLAAVRRGLRLEDAAAEAGCSLPGLYGARRRDRVFAAAWRDALEQSAFDERRIAPNNKRRLQRRKMRHVRFTDKRRAIFLSYFAGTCDAVAAAEAAGVDDTTVYKHRIRDAAFAAAFQEALEQGYVRLEAEALRQRVEAQRRIREAPGKGVLPTGEVAVEFERVMKLLDRWDRRNGRVGPRTVAPARRETWTFDEAIDALHKRLQSLAIPIQYLPGAREGE